MARATLCEGRSTVWRRSHHHIDSCNKHNKDHKTLHTMRPSVVYKILYTLALIRYFWIFFAGEIVGVCIAADEVVVDCPGKDEAFVTTCSGIGDGDKHHIIYNNENVNNVDFDESDLVNEVIEDSQNEEQLQRSSSTGDTEGQHNNNNFNEKEGGAGFSDTAGYDNSPMQQLRDNINTLTKRYYDPLPRNGKVAIGIGLGFISSRICLGVANRMFRLAGATWVLSEMLYTSGFCDEAKCVPEEARPWVHILRRALVNQSLKVRMMARRIYNQDRIRELVKKDEFVSGGFATGAFIGFVI